MQLKDQGKGQRFLSSLLEQMK